METKALSRTNGGIPAVFDDFFRPWGEWFDNDIVLNKFMKVPAVNVTEDKDVYKVSLPAPGLKKEDF